MDLLTFAEWCEATALGTAIRESTWAFAVIESVHLLALSVIGGAILLVDLRLLGLGLTRHDVRELASDAQRWQTWSLLVLIVTGIGLFLSESVKCYYSFPFWYKISALIVITIFTYTVRRKVVFSPQGQFGRGAVVAVALVSMTMWFTVGAAGRWIGFSG
jgi:hypothetical protein